MTVVQCQVWVCPTPGCGNYFASSASGDLSKWNTDAYGNNRFLRSRCPVCATHGMEVHRVPFIIPLNPTAVVEAAS
jgi:hypothetical protein